MESPPEHPPTPPSSVPFVDHVHKSGQDALWAAYIIFVLATIYIAVAAARVHIKHRVVHLIALILNAIAALSYFAMATHSGVSYIPKGRHIIDGEETLVIRQIFWARYINWLIGHPLMFGMFPILAGLPWVDVALLMLSIFATFGAIFGIHLKGQETVHWGWFSFYLIFLLLVYLSLAWKGRKCAKQQHTDVSSLYTSLFLYMVVIAIVAVTMFTLCDVKCILDVNTEVITWAVIDVLSKAVLGIWLVLGYKYNEDEEHVACFSDSWTKVRGGKGKIQPPGVKIGNDGRAQVFNGDRHEEFDNSDGRAQAEAS